MCQTEEQSPGSSSDMTYVPWLVQVDDRDGYGDQDTSCRQLQLLRYNFWLDWPWGPWLKIINCDAVWHVDQIVYYDNVLFHSWPKLTEYMRPAVYMQQHLFDE